jgi:hypothetical protein
MEHFQEAYLSSLQTYCMDDTIKASILNYIRKNERKCTASLFADETFSSLDYVSPAFPKEP